MFENVSLCALAYTGRAEEKNCFVVLIHEFPTSTGDKLPWELNDAGILAPPGQYSAQLAKLIDNTWTDLGEPQTFNIEDLYQSTLAAKEAARTEKFAFEQKLSDLKRAIEGANRVVGECDNRLRFLKQAVTDTPKADVALLKEIDVVRDKLTAIKDILQGDPTYSKRMVADPPSISGRIGGVAEGLAYTTQPPTGTQKEQYEIAAEDFGAQLTALKIIAETDIPAIEAKLEAAGAPWTPGRLPSWKK